MDGIGVPQERPSAASGEPHVKAWYPSLGAPLLLCLSAALSCGRVDPAASRSAPGSQRPKTAQATAPILETDHGNPPYLVGGVDQTLSPGWASDICGGKTFLKHHVPPDEWMPVFGSEVDDPLVGFAGTLVEDPQISNLDMPFTHPFGTDWEFFVAPDQAYASLLAPSNGCTDFTPTGECVNSIANTDGELRDAVENAHREGFALPTSPLGVQGLLGLETDQGLVPPDYRGRVRKGDRVAVFGRWIADCGHEDFHSEVHPPLLMAFARPTTGSAGQPVTFSEVISRPYLVSQTFDDGSVRRHLFNELLKGVAVPDCPGVGTIVDLVNGALEAALGDEAESGGCRGPCLADVCAPVCCTYCVSPELWFTVPCTTRFEAHQRFLPKPFAGLQRMSYIVRPPSPRVCAGHKLLVTSHFTVRHGVSASIEPFTADAARVVITMDEGQYTAPPLPPKVDLSLSLDDIHKINDTAAEVITGIRFGLLAVDPGVGVLFNLILERGLLTDCYDPSYAEFFPDHPECGALTPLQAASPADSQNGVVAAPIDQLPGPVSAEDNGDGQPFPVYGSASVEWSQEKFPPAIAIVQPAATQYRHSDVLTLDYSVTDTGCGVASVTALLDGLPMLDGHGLESGQAIPLLTELALGDHVFTVEAADDAGNTSTASVTFSIIVTPDSIEEDVGQFLGLGDIRPALANSLLAKLRAAAAARARGNCTAAGSIYGAFVNELQAQSGKGVDAAAAAILIADAEYLIAHCP
jgi:hypothetical protein